jgi:hypothetical protein
MTTKSQTAGRRFSSILLIIFAATLLAGCATRTNRQSIIARRVARVDLVSEVRGFSKKTPRGYQHPAIISKQRLSHILNAIEVETPQEKKATSVRQPGIHPDLVERAAEALAEGFAEAGPDDELGVKLIRKEMKLGLFHRKYLTSFIAYMQDDYLYLQLSRVDWLIPEAKKGDKLPEPQRNQSPMKFRVVSGEHLFYAGPQILEIAWRDPVFRQPYRLPGSTEGGKRRREVLVQAPIPKDERDAASAGRVALDTLSPEQLRALADLEEDRREGRITENAYQRSRRQLLRPR